MRCKPFGWVLAGMLLLALGGPALGQVDFLDEELLFDPRPDGVTLCLMPSGPARLYVEYGEEGAPLQQTPARFSPGGERVDFDLGGLAPDGSYVYTVFVAGPGDTAFAPRATHGFHTLRSPGATFSFAVLADSHAFALWAKAEASPVIDLALPLLEQTFDNVLADPELDFVLIGTDTAMTKCAGGCKSVELGGLVTAEGDAASLADARVRYRQVFSPALFGSIGRDVPLLYMLGDHDGERGFGGAVEPVCGYTQQQYRWSHTARMEALPDTHGSYGGGPGGTWYAVRTGDLLLVVLDVLRYTQVGPTSPEDWTLGAEQLAWLDRTLARSDATFKIVTAEHLLGGVNDPTFECWKARGGITATGDGTPTGVFSGEQALVHEILKAHHAQLFLSFHDHVVVWGEKPGPDGLGEGVVYAIGGRAGGVGHPWTDLDWYRTAMDYDGDGVPEYETGVTGTTEPGYFKITVHGDQSVDLTYLRTTMLAGTNGKPILDFTLLP